jgi:TolB-like protein
MEKRQVKIQHWVKTSVNICIISVLLIMTAWVNVSQATGKKIETEPIDQVSKTLAILPFDNNSVTDPDLYAPLSKGLSAMLITDLNKSGSTLKLVERTKIDALLQEIMLGQTGSVDSATAVKVGKILGAQTIAFGSFMVLGRDVRIDVRIIKVETSELVISEAIMGKSDSFMELESKLAGKIANSLRMAFQPQKAAPKSDIQAALYFSKGLAALDQGDKELANEFFVKSIKLDPAYRSQVEGLGQNIQ